MKQKIVIKVQVIKCDNCRSKAMETAAAADGVISVRLVNRENIVVTGDGVDAANLCIELKEKLGYASLEIVEELMENTENNETNPTPTTFTSYASSCPNCRDSDSCPCTIL